jgi:hypothetical protein
MPSIGLDAFNNLILFNSATATASSATERLMANGSVSPTTHKARNKDVNEESEAMEAALITYTTYTHSTFTRALRTLIA